MKQQVNKYNTNGVPFNPLSSRPVFILLNHEVMLRYILLLVIRIMIFFN